MLVHVAGWNKGCVFRYKGTEAGKHKLQTPKYNKIYHTYNQLLYTRNNTPK